MSAPEAVVQSVQEALGCEASPYSAVCYAHDQEFGPRGCMEAVDAADAAFTASLEWAAEQLDFYGSAVDPIRWLEQLAGDS